MLKLLAFLWCGCWHKWATFETLRVFGQDYSGNTYDIPIAYAYHLRCERCGEVKQVRL